jgi:hypothetical protein
MKGPDIQRTGVPEGKKLWNGPVVIMKEIRLENFPQPTEDTIHRQRSSSIIITSRYSPCFMPPNSDFPVCRPP